MKRKSALLIAEPPIQVLPSLAVAIGLNEAMLLQQIHYWLGSSKHRHEGKVWIYNTYADWQAQLPFWSVNTIRRTVKSLEDKNLIETGNFNKLAMDRTRWYTINYERLAEIEASIHVSKRQDDVPTMDISESDDENEQIQEPILDNASAQNEHMEEPIMDTAVPETTKREQQENNQKSSEEPLSDSEIVQLSDEIVDTYQAFYDIQRLARKERGRQVTAARDLAEMGATPVSVEECLTYYQYLDPHWKGKNLDLVPLASSLYRKWVLAGRPREAPRERGSRSGADPRLDSLHRVTDSWQDLIRRRNASGESGTD